MKETDIGETLFLSAKMLIEDRYPHGWGGAAAVRTTSGKILTSVAPDTKNDALALCMEVGACLEAHKLNEEITYSICICRETEKSDYLILTPCGICQERLMHWGGNVLAAISNPSNAIVFKPLSKLMPDHWSQVNGR